MPDKDGKCLHEVDLALMAKSLEENTKDTKAILTILQGNNVNPGVITRIHMIKQSVSRVWKFVSLIIAGLVTLAFFIIRRSLA